MTQDRAKTLRALFQGFCKALVEAIFPSKCLICDAFDDWQPMGERDAPDRLACLTAPYFCASCQSRMTGIASPFCSRCGLPFVSREGEDHPCSECLLERKSFRKARAFGVYEGSLMEAIHRFKYARRTSLSRPLSALTKDTFCRFWGPGAVDLLIPVPLHIKRLRERGFNQAYLLIRRWAKLEKIVCDPFSLVRTRWTEPQTSLSRKERKKNMRHAFAVSHRERIEGQRILLVDDVYTTGSTANECARVLMEAGAEWVDLLTLARAV
ncbi:MAG: ComF family protein [Thermodesulfobacteriota bacterium]|nr:ComF family protein [Thermodesulfobacteriota bacterium]